MVGRSKPKILVLGAGVSGLSSALTLNRQGHDVTIWTAQLPPHTTSNKAAAVWYPFIVHPPERATVWAKQTLGFFFAEIVSENGTGVYPTTVVEFFPSEKADPWWIDAAPSFRRMKRNKLPRGYRDGYEIDAVVMVTDIYMSYLLAQVTRAEIPISIKCVRDFEEAFALADIVVNCTGLGSRKLCNDLELRPSRGQVLRVPHNGFSYSAFEEEGPNSLAYVIPRHNDIILGGTAQMDDWDTSPRHGDTREIIERCSALYPCFRDTAIIDVVVGLRPTRSSVRLEPEFLDRGKVIVHNYGHGGSGFTLSWGCALEVAEIVATVAKNPFQVS